MSKRIKIKILRDNAIVPTYGSNYSAGFDLYSCEKILIMDHQKYILPLGFATEIPKGYYVAIVPRSGLACKKGATVINSPGTIDSDYRGEWKVGIINHSANRLQIEVGDRIAQGILRKYEKVEFEEVEELLSTERDSGGFGSTGK